MRSRYSVAVVGCLLATLAVATLARPTPPYSSIETQANGLRTHRLQGDVGCSLMYGTNPVAAVVEGDPGASDPVKLRWADTGQISAAVWPDDFSITFGPGLVLRNDKGDVIAREGDAIEIDMAAVDNSPFPSRPLGTYDDPFIVFGWLAGTCYPYVGRDWPGIGS